MVRPLYPDVAILLRNEMAQLTYEAQCNVFETLEPQHRTILINAIELKERAIDIGKFERFEIEDDYQQFIHIFGTIHQIKDESTSSPELSRSYIEKIIDFIKSLLIKIFHKETKTFIIGQGASIQVIIDKNKAKLQKYLEESERIDKRLSETDGLTNSPEYEAIECERRSLLDKKNRHSLNKPNIEISLSELKKLLGKEVINKPEAPIVAQESFVLENVTPGGED